MGGGGKTSFAPQTFLGATALSAPPPTSGAYDPPYHWLLAQQKMSQIRKARHLSSYTSLDAKPMTVF